MISRLVNPLTSHSFFLFGARGTGKTYLLRKLLDPKTTLEINLLHAREFERLSLDPDDLARQIAGFSGPLDTVFIDEVQKVPQLLDVVHDLIESKGVRFALSGSSARKLRRGGANLLAGRAFQYHLFPLVSLELGGAFAVDHALNWGTLPKLLGLQSNEEKEAYLRTYVDTYLREEILEEQLVRNLVPFRRFLDISAQSSGSIVNYAAIARDVGSHPATVQSYFQILEDTLLGRFIHPFHRSVRKRQRQNPKFYYFDTGVLRAITKSLTLPLRESTFAYGVAFEHLVINEICTMISYLKPDYVASYLTTADGAEIDLILERPGLPLALIEIKSKKRITEHDLRHLLRLHKEMPEAEAFCLSQDPHSLKIENIRCMPWQAGLAEVGLGARGT